MPLNESIYDAEGRTIALADAHWAKRIIKALSLVEHLEIFFPGLINGTTPVSGSDLVDAVTRFLYVHTDDKIEECIAEVP